MQSQQGSPSFDIRNVTAEMMRVLSPDAQDVLALVAEHMRDEHEGATPPFSELMERGAQNRLFAVLIKGGNERVGYAVASLSPMLTTGKIALCVISRFVRKEYRSTDAYRQMIEHLKDIARANADGILLIIANEVDRSPVPWGKATPINATWLIEV